ncbi:hypothetical protein DTO166G4_5972 [Paecilomyces variotii]|nr:hypothetical protein DTO166G4_5972 [Paecilomyces variotii]
MTEPMPPIEQKDPTEPGPSAQNPNADGGVSTQVYLPRITIKYCTQCKWMLRAAYFGQELLSTFNTSLGEVALVPTTGGVFTVTIQHKSGDDPSLKETLLWDRKSMGGFPEVKNLKSLVRNVVDPSRDLGHVDRALGKEIKARDTAVAPNVTGPVSSSTGPAPTGGIVPSPASRTVAENTDTKPGMGAPAETIQRCGSAGNKNDREECEDCK